MPKKTKTTSRILNCIPSREIEQDWLFEHAVGAGLVAPTAAPAMAGTPLAAAAATAAAADHTDLRETWWTVGDQLTTGSCVGWATADSVLRWHFVKANRLAPDQHLSTRFIWMAAKETDKFVSQPTTFIELEGTSLKAALDIARKFGEVTDAVLPFNSGQLYPEDRRTFYAIAAQYKIASYFNLGLDPANWRTWLAGKGPVLTRLDVDATWDNASATQGNLDVYLPATAHGGHAVALVGYINERFIVRNSWGTGWGDQGYAYASLAYAQAAFVEAYGVVI
jgi:C1A family cysteine protease